MCGYMFEYYELPYLFNPSLYGGAPPPGSFLLQFKNGWR